MLPTLELARGTIRFLAVAVTALVFATGSCDADRLSPVNIDPPKTPVDEQTDGGLSATVSFAKADISMRLGAVGPP
jgi:hypothetical protein